MKYKGEWIMVEAEVAARVGESALLQCKVDFASDNTSIMWTRVAQNSADFNLVSYQGRRTRQSFVKQEDGSTSVLSQLIIPEVTEEDFSAFGCFAQNELGSDLKMVELKNLDNTITIKSQGTFIRTMQLWDPSSPPIA